jgi:endonuclease G
MPKRPPIKKVEEAIKALKSVKRDWLRRQGCTAIDVGFKIKSEKVTDDLALRFHVRRKLPMADLAGHEAVGGKGESKIGGFPVDVIEAEYGCNDQPMRTSELLEPEAVNRRDRVDPLVGGVSCGNPRISAGTIGAIVFDRATGDPCILSNWHVLAGSRSAVAGEAILQPGSADGGGTSDRVGSLLRFRLDRDMDAGLARLGDQREWSRDILELEPLRGVEEPELGMPVEKSGRTTGLTKGIIDGVSMTVTINYGSAGLQTLDDQIRIVPRPPWPAVDDEISRGGDSGSVWINEGTRRAVGLHFAGETSTAPSDEHAIANKMTVVSEGLNFSVLPLFRPRPPVPIIDRDLLRALICQRFPFLCGGRFPLPRPPIPIGGQTLEQAAQSLTACHCGQGAQNFGATLEEVDQLIDDIMAAMR